MALRLKKALKSGAGRVTELTGALKRRSVTAMTIIAFHRVNDELREDGITCSSENLRAFCRLFLDNFHVVPLAEQIAGCRRGLDLKGTLSVTFDDGYLDNFTVAAPILEELGVPATFFVTTGFVGSSLIPPWDNDLEVPQKWMNWDQVRWLVSRGFTIGSHTNRHLNLSMSDSAEVRADLEASQRVLERELGSPARLFAYPFGGRSDISEDARNLVREMGFECCLSCFGGVNPPDSDPYRLQRIGIGEWFATPHQFALEYTLGRV